MSAKIEFLTVWILSIIGFLAKHDVLFFVSISVQLIIGIKNLPGACKVMLIILYNLKRKLHKKLLDIQKNK
jgi:hypothetical protein